jgi:hypothetical protein
MFVEKKAHGTNQNIDGFYMKTTQKGGFSKLCVKIKKRCYTDLLHFSIRKHMQDILKRNYLCQVGDTGSPEPLV